MWADYHEYISYHNGAEEVLNSKSFLVGFYESPKYCHPVLAILYQAGIPKLCPE